MTNSAGTNRYMGLALEALQATSAKLRKNFVNVFIEILFLYVSVKKINSTQMGKYVSRCEQTYRNNFTKDVGRVAYNTHLVRKVFTDPSDMLAIAVDQSHITKSGKCTWGVGGFWSGCDQSVMPGLEITGIGVVNATRRECMALRAVQTPGKDWFKEHP
ncbi:MAG: transposase, partial [Bacteroidaceae bacterium]|nr:transposase [Bacteroidaceae bacterium]